MAGLRGEADTTALRCPFEQRSRSQGVNGGLLSKIDTTLTTLSLAGCMFMCEEEGTMRRKNTARLLILPLVSVLLVPGCATLTRKTTQRIPVTSVPAGATVSVNGVEQGVTPLMIWPDRKWKGQVIRIEAPGYNPVEIKLKRNLSEGPVLGNFFVGAMSGVVP